jgi:arsenite methyltransferase
MGWLFTKGASKLRAPTLKPLVRRRGSYGVDAPYLLPIPVLLIAGNIMQGFVSGTPWPFVAAGAIAACMGCGLYASLRGKFVVWSRLLDQLELKGDERVLDLGCGRGAVLLLAAERLTAGRALGVDLWRKGDQSNNSAAATARNAGLEGVAARVAVFTADMVALPFADGSFDVVLSSLAIHNIRQPAARDRAIDEAVRVLKKGGRMVIADIFSSARYRARLADLGMTELEVRGLGWRMWWSGPWMPTRLVTATKP